MAEASAWSCARAASSWATAESYAAWDESRSLLAMSCRAKSSVFRSRSRLVSTTATCAFAEDRALRPAAHRSEEHTSELQSLAYLVCRLLLEKKKRDCCVTGETTADWLAT